jgi:hypothetical protein
LFQALERTEIAGIREEAVFRTKVPMKGIWPILKCIALSTKYFYIADVLAGFSDKHRCLRVQKKACRKQGAWRKKRKYASFLWLRVFPLQFFPHQPLQDHRDSDIEASGVAVLSSFHQAVPGSFQVVVPVRKI